MTLHPAGEAGQRSASYFRDALGRQLDQAVALAGAAAEDWGFDGGRGGLGNGMGFRPGFSPAFRRPGGGDADAPAYRGGALSSNAQNWMRFAQASREEGGLGLTKEQAAGVVGNLIHESGAGIAPSGVTGDRGTAHGAAQWRHERFTNLQAKSAEWGLDYRTTQAQQRFMRWELDNSESRAYGALRQARTPEQASDIFNRQYERSADPGGGRRQAARRLFEQTGAEQQARSAAPGASGDAVDSALGLEGLHERRDRDTIRQYLRNGGAGMDPATTAWCAAFVNSSLQQHGIRGSGSNVANSFQRWGNPVDGDVQRGDVIVEPHGRGPGQVGGHVGLATGRAMTGRNGQSYIEMVSGNRSDRVERSWEPASRVIVRRSAQSQRPPAAVASEP